jgi:hypothetical protein
MDVAEDPPYGAYMPNWVRHLLAFFRNPKAKLSGESRARSRR